MTRLAAILSAAFLALAAPATAAPVSFVTSAGSSTLGIDCTDTGGNAICNLEEAEVDFRSGDDRLLDPSATFRFLKFEAKGTEQKNEKTGKGGDSFLATATLAFRINSILYTATSVGTGSFETKGGEFTRFSLVWSPIADLFVTGVGTLSVAFEDLDLRGLGLRGEGSDDDDYIFVNATITAVPLPAGAVLLLSGIALLGAARLRRRALA